MSEKILYCIGGGIPKDFPELNFISICSKKKLNNPVVPFNEFKKHTIQKHYQN